MRQPVVFWAGGSADVDLEAWIWACLLKGVLVVFCSGKVCACSAGLKLKVWLPLCCHHKLSLLCGCGACVWGLIPSEQR